MKTLGCLYEERLATPSYNGKSHLKGTTSGFQLPIGVRLKLVLWNFDYYFLLSSSQIMILRNFIQNP
jgi:hypothetical protein